MVWPTMSGMIVLRRDHVLMTRFSLRELRSSTFFNRWSSTNGPFFKLRGMVPLPPLTAGAAAADDELLRFLVGVPGAAFRLAPRRHRMAAAGRLAFAAAQRMVDRVHGDASRLRALALPAVAAGLTDLDQVGFRVADLAHGPAAVDRHAAHLGARQAQRGEVAFLGDQLDAHPRAPGELAALARLELDVVHGGADRDVAQRQGVARPDVRTLAALQPVADPHPVGGEDVALLAVDVVQQCYARIAVRVVLDRGHLGRHAVLVPLEIDDAVLLFVAA